MPSPLIGGALSDAFVWQRLSDVCLSACLFVAYIGPKSRTERSRKTKIGTEIGHVTCDSDTTFKVKRSKFKVTTHQAALLTATLTHEAGAAVTVRTYWAWETTATLRLLVAREALGCPRGRRGAGHIVSSRAQLVRWLSDVVGTMLKNW